MLEYCDDVTPEPALLKVKRLNSISLSSQRLLSSPLIIFTACLWMFSSLSVSFVNCGGKSWTLYSRPDKYIFIPVDAAQDPIYLHLPSFSFFTFITAAASLLTHVQPLVHQAPGPLSASLLPIHTRALWFCHPRGRNLHLSLLNFIQFCYPTLPAFPGLPVRSLPSDVSSSTPSLVSSTLDESTFNPAIQIIWEGVVKCGAQYQSLGDPTCGRLPA